MSYGFSSDPELEKSTNKVMAWGFGLMIAMALAFPVYLAFEPEAREDSRDENVMSLVTEGESIFGFNCAACHGENGEGVSAPALNSEQFLQSATDEQIASLISVGIPGTPMSAYSQDFAGPLTSEQIKGVTTFIRSWEEDAPDRPDWRTPTPATDAAAVEGDGGSTVDVEALEDVESGDLPLQDEAVEPAPE